MHAAASSRAGAGAHSSDGLTVRRRPTSFDCSAHGGHHRRSPLPFRAPDKNVSPSILPPGAAPSPPAPAFLSASRQSLDVTPRKRQVAGAIVDGSLHGACPAPARAAPTACSTQSRPPARRQRSAAAGCRGGPGHRQPAGGKGGGGAPPLLQRHPRAPPPASRSWRRHHQRRGRRR